MYEKENALFYADRLELDSTEEHLKDTGLVLTGRCVRGFA